MVYCSYLTIVPGDRDCIPTRFGDTAAVSGIASPTNSVTLLEAFGFGGSHQPLLIMPLQARFFRIEAYVSTYRHIRPTFAAISIFECNVCFLVSGPLARSLECRRSNAS
jgi:hypothetical protein